MCGTRIGPQVMLVVAVTWFGIHAGQRTQWWGQQRWALCQNSCCQLVEAGSSRTDSFEELTASIGDVAVTGLASEDVVLADGCGRGV